VLVLVAYYAAGAFPSPFDIRIKYQEEESAHAVMTRLVNKRGPRPCSKSLNLEQQDNINTQQQ
jgi:hypothetical protein